MRATNAEVMVINGTINKDWIRQYGEDIHNVRELYISKDVRKIEPDMLAVLDNLTTIVVDEDNPYYDSRDNCNAVIDSQTNELIIGCQRTVIPAGITGIGVYAFYGRSGLKSITIPYSISYISECAFGDCYNLVDVKMTSGIRHIGARAFAGCVSLMDVWVPEEIAEVQEGAFESVNHITYDGTLEYDEWGAWIVG